MPEDQVVGVVGLGYVGLPLAVSFAEAGVRTIGLEVNTARVAQLQSGSSPIGDVSDDRLVAALSRGLEVSEPTPEVTASCDAIFVCVPTPIDRSKNPDLGPVRSAASGIASGLRRGQLIVLQSTTYPGTTRGPFLEELERSGLVAGVDFDLAYAPERINPGDPASASARVPRLVGGTTDEATHRAAMLLEKIAEIVVPVGSPEVAELAKLHENIFRNVNIALVNQLALLCERMGVDVWEVIDSAATKPFGFMRFTPGPGVGGHCIPVDPYYLAWRAREFDFVDRFVETAADVNLAMPRHVVALCAEALNDRGRALNGAKVGIVGVAFKPDVVDARNSPAGVILPLLVEQQADVVYHDPMVATFSDETGRTWSSMPLDEVLERSDLIVIVTAHRAVDWDAVFDRAPLIVDTVNRSGGRERRPRQVLRLGAGWALEANTVGTVSPETSPEAVSATSPRSAGIAPTVSGDVPKA